MGVEPFLLASAMKMVISQRLGKRMCGQCAAAYIPTEVEQKMIHKYLDPIMDAEEVNKIVFKKGT
jgi:MSHA biogenesis protein MshE